MCRFIVEWEQKDTPQYPTTLHLAVRFRAVAILLEAKKYNILLKILDGVEEQRPVFKVAMLETAAVCRAFETPVKVQLSTLGSKIPRKMTGTTVQKAIQNQR